MPILFPHTSNKLFHCFPTNLTYNNFNRHTRSKTLYMDTCVVQVYLHLGMANTTIRRFLEGSIGRLMGDNPVDGVGNLLSIHSYVLLSLVETLGNKCAQPACTTSALTSTTTLGELFLAGQVNLWSPVLETVMSVWSHCSS